MRKIIMAGMTAFLCLILSKFAWAETAPEDFFKMIASGDAVGIEAAILGGFDINRAYGKRGDAKIPLIEAIKRCNTEIVETLLAAGADTEMADLTEMTPLMMSIVFATAPVSPKMTAERRRDAIEIVSLLIGRGADVNYMDIFSQTPLNMASSGMNYESSLVLTRKLLDAGAEVNPAIPPEKMSPLMWALAEVYAEWAAEGENRIELIKLLLDAGADPNATCGGESVLHLAALIQSTEITETLLRSGADKSARNRDGKTPFDIAFENSNFKAAKLLAAR
ncbi:MAG: ankyrin repeat domain-containing protein [Synergistaceae bacterium]|jgi:ankyrin repeat protein|nr:ankyrin repeat domain-containing protein [Synergistaceae bacterium]